MDLPQCEPNLFKVIGIARRRRVPHVCKLALVAQRAHIEQFGGHSRVEDKVAMEQLDLFECLVSSWNALGYSTITNVGFGLSVVSIWAVLVTTRHGGVRVGTVSP